MKIQMLKSRHEMSQFRDPNRSMIQKETIFTEKSWSEQAMEVETWQQVCSFLR